MPQTGPAKAKWRFHGGSNELVILASACAVMRGTLTTQGVLVVCHLYQPQIRQLNLTSNIMTRVMGDGYATAPLGDGGLAITARVPNPTGLAVTFNGDVYFSTA